MPKSTTQSKTSNQKRFSNLLTNLPTNLLVSLEEDKKCYGVIEQATNCIKLAHFGKLALDSQIKRVNIINKIYDTKPIEK